MSIIRESGVTVTRFICTRCGSRYTTPENCPLCGAAVRSLNESAADDPLVGTVVADRYQVMARIGKGSVGSIFRAIDTLTEKQVAIKILRKHLVRDADLRRRFEQEATALKRLQHKNIIAVRDYGVAPEPYFVMEYIDGQSLLQLIGELTYIPAERFLPIILQACEAMKHAHDNGVLHRDMKPANIMLIDLPRHKELVKVVDFGLAKIVDEASLPVEETNPGDVLGTPLYMSPEQARGRALDARTDVYSLGCVMYECLTGTPPIKGSGVMEILHNQQNYTPPPMSQARPFVRIPQKLEEIVAKCLRKDPAERYNSMIELIEELSNVDCNEATFTSAIEAFPALPRTKSFWDRLKEAVSGKAKPETK